MIGEGTIGVDGKFTVTIPVQKAGTELEMVVTDWAGNKSESARVIIKQAFLHGWVKKDNLWYYYDLESGQKQTGWIKDKNIWYFLDVSGAMRTGWLKDNNKWYYLDRSGAMKTGSVNISGKINYFNSSGIWIK